MLNRTHNLIYRYFKKNWFGNKKTYDYYDFKSFITIKPTLGDMSNIITVLLFNKTKICVYKLFYDITFNSFSSYSNSSKSIKHRWNQYIQSNGINLDKILILLFESEKEEIKKYFTDYIKQSYESVFQDNNLNNEIAIMFDIINKLKKHICYYDLIPSNVIDVLRYISNNRIKNTKNSDNDGLLVEKVILKKFNEARFAKKNLFNNLLIVPKNKGKDGKGIKGEIDLIVGNLIITPNNNVKMIIRSIYDIKRSARLIPNDIVKMKNFINEVENLNLLINIDNLMNKGINNETLDKIKQLSSNNNILVDIELTYNFNCGYIYVNEWITEIETYHLLKEYLISYIHKHSHIKNFFKYITEQIKIDNNVPIIDLHDSFKVKINEFIVNSNKNLYKNLNNIDVRKL